jgi:IS1 family transposase
MAWVLGGREAATFQRFYDKRTHLTNGSWYTDQWDAFAQVLPTDRHSLSKSPHMRLHATTPIRNTTSLA